MGSKHSDQGSTDLFIPSWRQFWDPFEREEAFKFALILYMFLIGPLDGILPILGAKGVPKVAQRDNFEDRNHHFEGWRGPKRPLVQHFARNVFRRASRNGFFADLLPFWCPNGGPLGGLGRNFLVNLCILFQRSIFQ